MQSNQSNILICIFIEISLKCVLWRVQMIISQHLVEVITCRKKGEKASSELVTQFTDALLHHRVSLSYLGQVTPTSIGHQQNWSLLPSSL